MACILIAWELGEAFGHLARCLRLAEVLVGDHAPTALLAAYLAGIPHVAIGNGFAIPPATSPWPSIRPWEKISDETLIAAEQGLDRVTGGAQKALGHTDPVCIRELFGTRDVLDTFAELDHYGERSNGRYVGPIVSVPNARRVSWQAQEGAKVLAYLRTEVPGVSVILQALARIDAEVLCIAPGMKIEAAKRFATRRMRISLAPVDLPPLFEHANLGVSYGNSGLSTQSLLAGEPLLMRPRHVEQALFAHRVETLGAGRLLRPNRYRHRYHNITGDAAQLGASSSNPSIQRPLPRLFARAGD